MQGFWRTWMNVWCGAVALFGIALAGGAMEATSGPVRMNLELLGGPGELDLNAHLRFSLAVCGAVTMGWSLTLFAAMRAANQLGKQAGNSIWVLITLSVVGWYLIDSGLSVLTGFGLNVIPNTALLLGYLVPVLRTGVLKT